MRESFGNVAMAMMILPRYWNQTVASTFPTAEDWTSGDINWLLDIIVPDQKTTANFRQVVKGGNLRLHPIVSKLSRC